MTMTINVFNVMQMFRKCVSVKTPIMGQELTSNYWGLRRLYDCDTAGIPLYDDNLSNLWGWRYLFCFDGAVFVSAPVSWFVETSSKSRRAAVWRRLFDFIQTICQVFLFFYDLLYICQGSSDRFYIVIYYIKWVTTSWTYSTYFIWTK